MKKLSKIIAVSLILSSLVITGCSSKQANTTNNEKDNKIVIGVSPTPHEPIINNLLPKFKEAGLEVEVKTFNDYVQPNIALNDGDLDANYFQHQPYLEQFNKDHGFNLVSIGSVHLEPLGAYSTKIRSLNELKEGDEVLIPNDPSNSARALVLLEQNGLIKLKNKGDIKSTEKDIVENKKNLKITAVDAPVIPTAYNDVAIGIINSNYAISANIDPSTALFRESGDNNPYANLVAVKEENKDKPKFKKFMEILQSAYSEKFINEKFKGEIIPAFSK